MVRHPHKLGAILGRKKVLVFLLLVLLALLSSTWPTLSERTGRAANLSLPSDTNLSRDTLVTGALRAGNEGAAQPQIQIELISPTIGSLIQESRPTFRWKLSGFPLGVQRVIYALKVVEVLPEQGLEEALLKNKEVVGRDLTEDQFQLQKTDGELAREKIYAWRIAAFDRPGNEISRSSASFFAVGAWPPWHFCFLIPIAQTINYCIGQTVAVANAFFVPSGGPYSWTLTPGGGSGVSTSPTITLPAGMITTPGTHNYTLTVSGPGCPPQSLPITIVASPQATAGTAWVSGAIHQWDPPNWTQFANLCCGSALKLKLDPPIVGNIQWEQSINNGPFTAIPGATGASVNINSSQLPCNPAQPVPIRYRARVSTTSACADFISNNVYVVIYPPAQGTVTASPTPICVGATSTISLTGNQAGTTVTWYQGPSASGPWTPLGLPAGTVSFPVTPGITTSYQAVVQWPGVTFPAGTCPAATPTVTVVVDQKPIAGTIVATPPIICPGDDSVLTLTGSSGLVQWYSSTNPNPTTFFTPGNMIVGATNNTTQDTNILNVTTYYGVVVSSPNGVCPAVQSAIVPVIVKPNPGPITISGPAFICPFGSATLNVTSGGGSGHYQWYCDGAPCGPNSSTMTVTEPGNYQLEYDEGCAPVQSNIVTIQPDLLTVAITGPCCSCNGKKVKLCAAAANGVGPYTYSWSNGATTSCILVIPNVTTTYTVTVTDTNGCKVSQSFTVTVCQ